jgi:hypothetical protein
MKPKENRRDLEEIRPLPAVCNKGCADGALFLKTKRKDPDYA